MKSIKSRTILMPAAWYWFAVIFAVAWMPATAEDVETAKSAGSLLKALSKSVGIQEAELETAEAQESDSEPEATNEKPLNNNTGVIRVSPQGGVEIHVRDRDLGLVLQMLSMQSQRNIVASKNVSGKVTADFYGVTFNEALTAILDSNSCGWIERGNFIYVYTNDELSQMDTGQQQMVSKLFHLHYTKATDIKTMVDSLCSKDGRITVTPEPEIGVASNAEEAGGDALAGKDCLLVVDYPENIEAISKVIAQIDVRPKQVLIEATILRAQLNEDNALGIDFHFVGGVDFQALNSVSNGVTNINTGNLPQAELSGTTYAGRTDFSTAIPDGGLTFGIIKDSVAVFIRALEQVTDTSVLANPKILTLNKQRGEVIVGRRDGYITTTVTETVATQTVEFLETGTQLVFRPFIGDDGYIRMEVHPEDSVGGLTASNLPFERTTEVTTNIIVRDGHTILIGGLFREVTTAARDQLPLLGNIPIVGTLFRNTRDSTQREEVIILLTVHIIKDNDSDDLASIEARENIERYRVGMRQGLRWYGRERLAQAHYRWALEHLAKGHLSKAMWDLDLALNNNPKFLVATKLKEKLLDRREWDDDSSGIRGFLMGRIMKEQGLISPIFGRPGPPFEYPLLRGPSGLDQGKDAGSQTSLAPLPEAELPLSNNSGKGDS